MLNRRNLLKSGGLAALGLILPPFVGPEFLARKLMAGTGGTGQKKMIFIFQRGGNDAINTVIPRGDADYSTGTRPGLFINDTEALDLGNGFAQLHPSLQPLMEVFNNSALNGIPGPGNLAVLHRIGYPRAIAQSLQCPAVLGEWRAGERDPRRGYALPPLRQCAGIP